MPPTNPKKRRITANIDAELLAEASRILGTPPSPPGHDMSDLTPATLERLRGGRVEPNQPSH